MESSECDSRGIIARPYGKNELNIVEDLFSVILNILNAAASISYKTMKNTLECKISASSDEPLVILKYNKNCEKTGSFYFKDTIANAFENSSGKNNLSHVSVESLLSSLTAANKSVTPSEELDGEIERQPFELLEIVNNVPELYNENGSSETVQKMDEDNTLVPVVAILNDGSENNVEYEPKRKNRKLCVIPKKTSLDSSNVHGNSSEITSQNNTYGDISKDMEPTFVSSIRNSKKLHLNGYIYTKHRSDSEGNTTWRCENRRCPGKIRSNVQDKIIENSIKPHCHPPTPTESMKQQVTCNLKARAASYVGPSSLLVREVLSQTPEYVRPLISEAAAKLAVNRKRKGLSALKNISYSTSTNNIYSEQFCYPFMSESDSSFVSPSTTNESGANDGAEIRTTERDQENLTFPQQLPSHLQQLLPTEFLQRIFADARNQRQEEEQSKPSSSI